MIAEELAKALNDQVTAEYYSAYLYLAMSAYAEEASLKGAANWLFVQAKEEMAHGTHMLQYILDRGAKPLLGAIEQPPSSFAGIADVFEQTIAHEQKVTASINAIADLAMKNSDHACYQFIMWYVNEQVEEESNDNDILNKLKLIGDSKGHILDLDTELGARVYANPFPMDTKLIG